MKENVRKKLIDFLDDHLIELIQENGRDEKYCSHCEGYSWEHTEICPITETQFLLNELRAEAEVSAEPG